MGNKLEEAKELIQKEQEEKQKAFAKEYDALCKKHGLEIVPVVNLRVNPTK